MKKTIAKKTAQQGDVLLRKLKSMPSGDKKRLAQNRLVLAHGESGHSHVLEDDSAELVQIGERILLNLTRQATVTHEEHKAITLEPGVWEVGRVREYDYFQHMVRQVVD